jgi:hypothetical protein
MSHGHGERVADSGAGDNDPSEGGLGARRKKADEELDLGQVVSVDGVAWPHHPPAASGGVK